MSDLHLTQRELDIMGKVIFLKDLHATFDPAVISSVVFPEMHMAIYHHVNF